MSNQPLLNNNTLLGPFKVIRRIGEGGMGEVYEGEDTILTRKVALKVILPSLMGDSVVVKRFLAEGKTLARLNHPNVVTVYALGESQGIHYIAMEFIDGKPLDRILKAQSLEFDECLFYMKQILEGTRALHENEIIHRDLKPKNIMVSNENGIKIVDFGVAKTDTQIDLDLTSKGMLVGSVSYLSPEIVRGTPATVQSDIWSLGIMFYEMLYRQKPFAGENALAVLEAIKSEEMRFPSSRRLEIPDGIKWILLKMCEKNIEKRYTKVSEILRDLSVFSGRRISHLKNKDEKILIANEKELRRRISDRGYDSHDAQKILDTAVAIQKKWGEADLKHMELVDNRLGLKVTQSALAAAANSFKKDQSNVFKRLLLPLIRKKRWAPLIPIMIMASLSLVGWWILKSESPANIPLAQIEVISPKSDDVMLIQENAPIVFNWINGPSQGVIIEISLNPQFNQPLIHQPGAVPPFTVHKLNKEGTVYWRLLQMNSHPLKPLSETKKFTLVHQSQIKLLAPQDQIIFEARTPIGFKWIKKPVIKTYRIEISGDPYFSKLERALTSGEATVQLKQDLNPGAYYWRIVPHGQENLSLLGSEVRTFQVEKKLEVPMAVSIEVPHPEPVTSLPTPLATSAPQVAAQPTVRNVKSQPPSLPKIIQGPTSYKLSFKKGTFNNRQPAQFLSGQQKAPVFKWEKASRATSYEIQFAKEESFSQLIGSELTSTRQWAWVPPGPGTYFWRLRSIGSQNEKSSFTKANRIKIMTDSPKIAPLIQRTISSTIDSSGGSIVNLSWEEVPQVQNYKLEVSNQKSFTRIINEVPSDSNQASINIERPGTYFYRVSAIGNNGENLSAPSQVGELKVISKSSLSSPTPKLPLDGIAIVSLSNSTVPVVFSWDKVATAQNYKIEISKSSDFRELVDSTSTKDSQFLLEKSLQAGQYFWRVRAEKAGIQSEWSKPYSFEINNQ